VSAHENGKQVMPFRSPPRYLVMTIYINDIVYYFLLSLLAITKILIENFIARERHKVQ
jgi:hypothetical protein